MMATAPNNFNELDNVAFTFYRERLRDAFSISAMISGHTAEELVDTPEFARVIAEYGLGSLDSARRVGDMAVIHLDKIPTGIAETRKPGEWWRDLLSYERGYFLQSAITQQAPPWNRPRRGVSALCVNFAWNVPEVANRLKSGQQVTDDLRRPMTLLFARNQNGKAVVVEAGAAVEKIFRATNGMRTLLQIAETAEMAMADTERILDALSGVGAVVPAKSASEMMEALEAREREKA